MSHAQVERTLVKSHPELWAELSNPASLARHLGELGEIRITRIEPEHKVEWSAEGASGSVLIKPSGWGTRVTLTASRSTPAPPPTAAGSAHSGGHSGGSPGADGAPSASAPPAAPPQRVQPLLASGEPPVLSAEPLIPEAEDVQPNPGETRGPALPEARPTPEAPASDAGEARDSAPPDAHPAPHATAPDVRPAPHATAPDVSETPDAAAASPREDPQRADATTGETADREQAASGLLARLMRRLRRRSPARDTPPIPSTVGQATPTDHPVPLPPPAAVPVTPVSATASFKPAPSTATVEPSRAPAPVKLPGSTAIAVPASRPQLTPGGGSPAPAGPPPQSGQDDADGDEVEAVLKSVLDSLGSAHHRPFSRP
jgi:hypothetical protein